MGKIYYRNHEFTTPLPDVLDVQITNQSIVDDNNIAKIPNFTGTDGNEPGASGLVPAPTTTEANLYLKSDGTWDTPSGGSGGGGDGTIVQIVRWE